MMPTGVGCLLCVVVIAISFVGAYYLLTWMAHL